MYPHPNKIFVKIFLSTPTSQKALKVFTQAITTNTGTIDMFGGVASQLPFGVPNSATVSDPALNSSFRFFAALWFGFILVRSNFGSGGNAFIRAIMALARPLTNNMSDSRWEASQASLHVLLSDDAPKHSGAYFSQHSVLYRDKECRKGGFPMKTPNPNADDIAMAKKLVLMTRQLVPDSSFI